MFVFTYCFRINSFWELAMCYNFALFIYLYNSFFDKAVEYAIITVKTWLVS